VLTEKIARRGLHLTREYSIDPLEVILIRDVMLPVHGASSPRLAVEHLDGTVNADDTLRHVANQFAVAGVDVAPVVERAEPGRTVGVVTLSDLLEARLRDHQEEHDRERMLNVRLRPRLDQ